MADWRGRFLVAAALMSSLAEFDRVEAAPLAETRGSESETMLVGRVTREEIEIAMPGWVAETVRASPDPEAAIRLADVLQGAEVTVFLGVWCEDSQRELSRLWRALDEAGLVTPHEIRYIGVDRNKRAPNGLTDGSNLRLVPTFVVERGGVEVGRIVESSVNGIERDLLALLSGERGGLISGNPEIAAGDRP
jgi:hypothetical protein